MDGILRGMRSRCKGLIAAHIDRKRHIERLRKEVEAIRDGARRKEWQIRSDLEKARRTWHQMNETLKTKRAKKK